MPAPTRLRDAVTADVRRIRALVEPLAESRVLLGKEQVTLYEAVQEFVVAVADDGAGEQGTGDLGVGDIAVAGPAGRGDLVGCGALHVFWEDLAEVRTLAVSDAVRGTGVGSLLIEALLDRARRLGVTRVFCLTFETAFFARHGFTEIEGAPVTPEVFAQMLRSHDDGVAEFLDLARVKPNTLGNSRMIRHL